MMTAVAGAILNVNESKKATAPTGPNPGNTPTRVPTTEPRKQKSKLVGVSATEKPSATLLKISNLNPQDSARKRNAEDPTEDCVGGDGGQNRDHHDFRPALRLDRSQQENHQKKRAEQKAQGFEHQGERDHCCQREADSGPPLGQDLIGSSARFRTNKPLCQQGDGENQQ